MGKLNPIKDFDATVVWRDEKTLKIRHKDDKFFDLTRCTAILLFVEDLDASFDQLMEFNKYLDRLRNLYYDFFVVTPCDITRIIDSYDNKPEWRLINLDFLIDPKREIVKIMSMRAGDKYHEGVMMIDKAGQFKRHVQVNSKGYPVTVRSVLAWLLDETNLPTGFESFKDRPCRLLPLRKVQTMADQKGFQKIYMPMSDAKKQSEHQTGVASSEMKVQHIQGSNIMNR